MSCRRKDDAGVDVSRTEILKALNRLCHFNWIRIIRNARVNRFECAILRKSPSGDILACMQGNPYLSSGNEVSMTKLAKYLRPFLPGIAIAIVLLFVQSIAELMLPNRMSDIVNVGLQQSGIEHAAPDALSPQGYGFMTDILDGDTADFMPRIYQPFSGEEKDASGNTYRSLYPNMGETVYIRQDASEAWAVKDAREGLDAAFSSAAYNFVLQLQQAAAQSGQPLMGAQDASGGSLDISSFDFDMGQVYQIHQAMKAQGALTASPPSTGDDAGMGDMIGAQAGIMFAKAFYEELGADTADMQSGYIWRSGVYMLFIALLSGLAAVAVGYFAPRVAAGAAKNLRRDLFEKVESFSHHEFDKFSSASLITRCTNDIQQVQMLVGMGLRMLCSAPITGIGGIIMALNKAPSMSWIIAMAVIVLLGLVILVSSIVLPRFKVIQKMIDRLNKVSRETLNGLMVIRAFGTQKHEIKRFDDANKDLTKVNLFIGRVMAVVGPVITFLMSGTTLLIVWVGAHQISESGMQVGDMLAFMQYAIQVVMSFMMLSMMMIMIPRAAVSGDRIAEVLATGSSISDPVNPKALIASKAGTVEFKHVSFRYESAEDDAVKDISFIARPGQTTAIIGATGSGKTTLANLLLRFYDVTGGSICVDGVDVREVTQRDLRSAIGYVPQKGQLLAGTAASNIRYGRPDASDKEMEEAAEVAQAAEFISEKEDGYEFEISQGGANVSGGQKQRLSIARALAKQPRILVFDDSFSALDFKTDAKLRRALKQHTGQATVIIIAQRVGTIMGAEQILVVDHGTIVGRGTHEELLKSCPAYYEIASSQLEEVAVGTGVNENAAPTGPNDGMVFANGKEAAANA
jgi:ATP-binding cassette subfamily B protein